MPVSRFSLLCAHIYIAPHIGEKWGIIFALIFISIGAILLFLEEKMDGGKR